LSEIRVVARFMGARRAGNARAVPTWVPTSEKSRGWFSRPPTFLSVGTGTRAADAAADAAQVRRI